MTPRAGPMSLALRWSHRAGARHPPPGEAPRSRARARSDHGPSWKIDASGVALTSTSPLTTQPLSGTPIGSAPTTPETAFLGARYVRRLQELADPDSSIGCTGGQLRRDAGES